MLGTHENKSCMGWKEAFPSPLCSTLADPYRQNRPSYHFRPQPLHILITHPENAPITVNISLNFVHCTVWSSLIQANSYIFEWLCLVFFLFTICQGEPPPFHGSRML